MFQSLTFRMTLWYTGLFGALSLAVFYVVYLTLIASLNRRTDDELRDSAREFEALYRSGGLEALGSELRREAQSRGIERVFFQLLSSRGEVLASSDLSAWKEVLARGVEQMPGDSGALFETLVRPIRHDRVRVLSERSPEGHLMRIGVALHDDEVLVEKYRETFAVALAAMLLCGGFAGWFVSRRAMKGVRRVTHTAIDIGRGDLSRRVPRAREGLEIDELAIAFNTMLDRIQALLAELEEVSNNIAHDLRGPITRIRGIAETTLGSSRDSEVWAEMAGEVIEESDRLVEMINTMLEIAKADAGLAELSSSALEVGALLGEARDLFAPMAEDKGIALCWEDPGEPLWIHADVGRIQRVVANLLDNAIKYTEPGGSIWIRASARATWIVIEIADTGIGIDEADQERIFERFFRGDRSRSTPGNGLGLSLARSIVRAHGGEVEVASSGGRGSSFGVLLPRQTLSRNLAKG